MALIYEQVFEDDEVKVHWVFRILELSGKALYENQGLVHWRTPIPESVIKQNCEKGWVFLVKDTTNGHYVNTFQLFKENDEMSISKFATIPKEAGKGIGKKSMSYIEKFSRELGVKKLKLDVYDKSISAIKFYEKLGFVELGKKPTRYFQVLLMEKIIDN